MCEARRVLCELLDVPCVPILLPTGKQALGTKTAPDLVGFPFAVEIKWYKKMRPAVEELARSQSFESATQYDGLPLVMLREDGNTKWRIQMVATMYNGRQAWLELVKNSDLWHVRDFRSWRLEYINKVREYDEEQRAKLGDKWEPEYDKWLRERKTRSGRV